jgi:hypothetical protein
LPAGREKGEGGRDYLICESKNRTDGEKKVSRGKRKALRKKGRSQ